jgi:hypothetical protein
MPPITFPDFQKLVVSEAMKSAMITAGFRGISFRPVEKETIVKIHWERWNWNADEPKVYPPEGEPMWYLDRSHSESASEGLGELWEVVLAHGIQTDQASRPKSENEFCVYRGTRNDADLFTCPQNMIIYCSARAKTWFERHVPDWVKFKPLAFASDPFPPAPVPIDPLAIEAGFLVFGLREELILLADVHRWAQRAVASSDGAPAWITSLVDGTLARSEGDVAEVMTANAHAISHRAKLQALLLGFTSGRLNFEDAIKRLYRVQVTDSWFFNIEDEPLMDALLAWDVLPEPKAISTELRAELEECFRSYLSDAGEVARVLAIHVT